MAIAEVLLKIKNESGRTLQELTDSSEQYDATLKRVVDSVAKEEAAERQRAAALGVTVGQLRLAEEALEKQIALERAAAQAAANRPVIEMPSGVYEQQAKATEDLGKANWQTVQAAQSLKKNLGDVVSSLVAGMDPIQVFTQQIEQIADALSQGESPAAVFKQALGGLFGLIASNAATLGTLTLAIGAAGVAYRVYGQEADRVYSRRAFDQELTESLRDSELGLRDAMLDQREAVGALTAQEAGLLRIRYAIQDQAREYASDNQKKIDALNEEIEATKKYINFQRGVAAELAVIYTFTIGAGDTVRRTTAGESVKEVAASNARAINDIIDSFTGLEAGSDDARAKIESLNQATQENASNLQETRKAQEEALKATLAGKDAKKEATAAEKEHTEELKRQKKYLEDLDNAYKRYIANQKILHDAIISNDPLAQENDRYQAYTDSILAATDALAAQAVHEGNLAEATRIRMEGLKALDAARLQHFENTGAQGATNDAFLYDQGLGGPSIPVAAPTKQGITAAQGLEAATSLSSLVKLDPSGIASGVYAGMKAAIDVGKGGGALGELKTMLDDLGGALPGLAGGIKDLVKGILSDSIPALFDGLTDTLLTLPGDLIDGLLDGVPDIIGALAKDAPRLITEMVTLQPRVASALIAAILSPSTWVDAAKALADGLGDGLKSAWSDLGTMTQDIGKGLETGVEFLVRSAGSLYDGVASLFSADTWKTIGDEIADSLKDLFGGLFGREDKTGLFQKNGAISQAGESVGDWFTNAGKTVSRWFDKGLVGSFDVGTDYVSRTGLAVVHQGETIVPAHGATQAAAIQRAGSGGGMTVILQGAITSDEEALARRVQDAARRGLDFNGVSLG